MKTICHMLLLISTYIINFVFQINFCIRPLVQRAKDSQKTKNKTSTSRVINEGWKSQKHQWRKEEKKPNCIIVYRFALSHQSNIVF